jgi:hypothetical protein
VVLLMVSLLWMGIKMLLDDLGFPIKYLSRFYWKDAISNLFVTQKEEVESIIERAKDTEVLKDLKKAIESGAIIIPWNESKEILEKIATRIIELDNMHFIESVLEWLC